MSFKEGDLIRVSNPTEFTPPIGSIGTVRKIGYFTARIEWIEPHDLDSIHGKGQSTVFFDWIEPVKKPEAQKTMSEKFKRGDRVASTINDEEYPPIGTLGTITENYCSIPEVIWDAPYTLCPFRGGRGCEWPLKHESALRPVSTETTLSGSQESISKKYKFKKGDRVVSIVTAEGWPPIGTLGTISENNSPDPYITWDGPYPVVRKYGEGWGWMHEKNLELAPTKNTPETTPKVAQQNMNVKFKRGDRVVSTINDSGVKIGYLGTVDTNNSETPWVKWDPPCYANSTRGRGWRPVNQYNMKLVSTENISETNESIMLILE
jgi:hypothetical protein